MMKRLTELSNWDRFVLARIARARSNDEQLYINADKTIKNLDTRDHDILQVTRYMLGQITKANLTLAQTYIADAIEKWQW